MKVIKQIHNKLLYIRGLYKRDKLYRDNVFTSFYSELHHKGVYSKMSLTYNNTGGNLWLKKESQ